MKRALVTGVSWTTGIGFAIAKQLLKADYYVYAVYHSDDSTAKEYFDGKHTNIEFVQCDLTSRKNIAGLIERLSNVELNAIINNAGAFSGGKILMNMISIFGIESLLLMLTPRCC